MFSDPAAVGEVLYPLADNVGTVRDLATYDEVADETTIAHHREFDSFGALLTPITDAHAFAFTGREFDTDSNLQYSRNRWFDNSIGKFVSEDPMSFDAGDANITRYVFNNPLTASDPSGLGFFSDIFDSVGDFFEDVGDTISFVEIISVRQGAQSCSVWLADATNKLIRECQSRCVGYGSCKRYFAHTLWR